MGSEKIDRVEDMPVYQLFYKLALEVEKVTRDYGPDFRWLRIQTLRASESVCANMTEGFYAQYSTEYLQGLYRSRREARETMTHVNYGADAGVLQATIHESLITRYEDSTRQLGNLISSIERKIQSRGKSKPTFSGVKEEVDDYRSTHQPLTINH